MTPFPVIIDNDSLIHLSIIENQLPIIDKLRSVFSKIHIPEEVFYEFQNDITKNPYRFPIIRRIENNTFLKKCTEFDLISRSFYATYKGIDKGEAAAIAQHLKIGGRFIISEDKSFHKRVKELSTTIKIIKLKHVLALLDIHHLIEWKEYILLLHQCRKITSSELRQAYIDMVQLYGLSINKKLISEKCSLKKLGIT